MAGQAACSHRERVFPFLCVSEAIASRIALQPRETAGKRPHRYALPRRSASVTSDGRSV